MSQSPDITKLLRDWSAGQGQAFEELMPLVFDDLRRMASRYLNKEAQGHILQSTALVNEVLIKLLKRRSLDWKDRKQFFGFVANQMRNTLVDYARLRDREKRGSGACHSTLDEAMAVVDSRHLDLVALDDALKDLAEVDPEARSVVELRFIVGLKQTEIAEILGVSKMTVRRRWRKARIWLYRELSVAGGIDESRSTSRAVVEVGQPGEGQPPGVGRRSPAPPARRRDSFLQARFPDAIPLGSPVALQARIVLKDREDSSEASPQTPKPASVARIPETAGTPLSKVPEGMEGMLVLHSPHFEQEGGNMRRFTVPAGSDSEWVVFTLKALRQGVHTPQLTAYCSGSFLGALVLKTRVDATGEASVDEMADEEYLEQIDVAKA